MSQFSTRDRIPGTVARPIVENMTGFKGSRIELSLALHDKRRREMERSLHAFVRGAWHILEPGREFIDNWHLHSICEHLEAVTLGQVSRLLINVPFRTSKSTYVSVGWPAWEWIKRPDRQYLTGSYAEKLAVRDALKMRRLVTSEWYQSFWPDAVTLAHDQNEKRRFSNTANGQRIAFGVNSVPMGDGADRLIVDDPHDRQGAKSDVQREDAIDQYDQGMVTRLNSPDTDPIVIIMQRLHEADLSGHVLKEKGWTHLMLPMRYEAARHCRTKVMGFSDPRTIEGELMWPRRFSEATVRRLQKGLGEYGTSGQLQQRPSPAGGGILDTKKYRIWPATVALPVFRYILQSYDTAYTDKTANDPTACTVWGVFSHTEAGVTRNNMMLLDAWTDFLKYPDLKKKMVADWKAVYGGDAHDPMNKPRRPDAVLIEDKGSGKSLQQDMRQSGIPVMVYDPGRASKTARAQLTAPLLEDSAMWVIESRKERGMPIRWARPLLLQEEQFPNGEHDDLVDTHTQATIFLQSNDMLERPDDQEHEEPPPKEIDYHQGKRRANAYD